MMDLATAVRLISSHKPPLNRTNRVPVLVGRLEAEGWAWLRLDVVDAPMTATGELPRTTQKIAWWGIARKVHEVEDVPRVVGEMYEALARKLLDL